MQHLNPQVENYLRDLLLIYFARQRLILTVTAVVFLIAALVAFFGTPIYAAQGAILLRSGETQRSPDVLEDSKVEMFRITEEDLRSEVELIRSPAVIQGAINKFVEAQHPLVEGLDWLKIREKLLTEVVPDSRVINVVLQRNDVDQAIDILNAILDEYILRRSQIIYPEGSTGFFTSQVNRFSKQLEETEGKMAKLAADTRTTNPSVEIQNNLLSQQRINDTLDTLGAQADVLREQIQYLNRIIANKEIRHFSFLDNKTVTEIAASLVDLQIERGKTARYYDDNSQAVSVIDKQIQGAIDQLRREVDDYRQKLESDLAANNAQQSSLKQRLIEIQDRNLQLNLQSLEVDKLNRQAELLQQSVATFFKRQQESEINTMSDSGMSQFQVSILNSAWSTGIPVFPNRPLLLVIGLFAGLITGFSLGFIREFLDHTFKNPRDLEQFSGLPLLFSTTLINKPSRQFAGRPPDRPTTGLDQSVSGQRKGNQIMVSGRLQDSRSRSFPNS